MQRHQGGEVGVTATTSGSGWGRGVSLGHCGGNTHTRARATQLTLQLTFPEIFPECTFHFSADRTHSIKYWYINTNIHTHVPITGSPQHFVHTPETGPPPPGEATLVHTQRHLHNRSKPHCTVWQRGWAACFLPGRRGCRGLCQEDCPSARSVQGP